MVAPHLTPTPRAGLPMPQPQHVGDNGLDTLVNAYTREFRHVEAEGFRIADVLGPGRFLAED